MADTTVSTKVLLRDIRLSYFNGWHATAIDEKSDKKYSTAILIPKDNAKNVDAFKEVMDALVAEAKAKNKGKLPPKFKLPLRDGDEEKPDDENYAGMYFINANSTTKPGIVGKEKDENGKPKPITDESQVYSGCYAHVTVNLFLYEAKGNVGIGCGLNNIMKTKDGAPLAGKSSAAEDFAEIEDDSEGENYL